MNDYEKFHELASDNDLKFIETTSGTNGYPKNLQPALVGFETYEDAEEFAREHDLQTYIFHKRNGWQLWERKNPAYEPFHTSAEDYGDNYNMFKAEDKMSYYENEVKPCLDNFYNFDSLKAFIEEQEEILDELDRCYNNEAVITYCGKYYDTVKVQSMKWRHDTHTYVIGVM